MKRWIVFKPKLIVKGYKQQASIDNFEVFALVTKLDTWHMIVSLAIQNKWKIHQIDVKLDFLNGILEENEYME